MKNNNVQENEIFQEDESKTKKIIVKLDKKILMFVNSKRGKEILGEGFSDLVLENEDWLVGVYNKSEKLIAIILRDKKREKAEDFMKEKVTGRIYVCIREFLENGERGCETLRGTNIGGQNLEFFYEFPARETSPFSKNFKLVEPAIIEFGPLEQKNIFKEGIVLDRFDISIFKIIKKGKITEE